MQSMQNRHFLITKRKINLLVDYFFKTFLCLNFMWIDLLTEFDNTLIDHFQRRILWRHLMNIELAKVRKLRRK